MDLFADVRKQNLDRVAPLAVRMRPRTLDDFVGQQHFMGPGKLLRRMLEADRLTSVLFFGPPGTGKTTLAALIAGRTQSHFDQLNAAAVGVKEVRQALDAAKERLGTTGRRTVLFLDEIHRFNRAQQDILLPDVEAGLILLIGATTENPFFSVNSPLISRSQVFQFSPLDESDIRRLLQRAVEDRDRGFGSLRLTVDAAAFDHWATICDGDARRALMALEVAVLSLSRERESSAGRSPAGDDTLATTPLHITLDVAEQSIQQKAIVYDGRGDEHYDAASALIKSMRGSDPDAAIYWLARMLEAGEDPRFIARRVAILASEDVGNADPHALSVAASAYQIVERIGMPEARITLAQAVTYMAAAPKSNRAYQAICQAQDDVRNGRTIPVPKHLRDGSYSGAKRLGHGKGYVYSHDQPEAFVAQDYLGVDRKYYVPSDRGYEVEIARRLNALWNPTPATGQPVSDESPQKSDQTHEPNEPGSTEK